MHAGRLARRHRLGAASRALASPRSSVSLESPVRSMCGERWPQSLLLSDSSWDHFDPAAIARWVVHRTGSPSPRLRDAPVAESVKTSRRARKCPGKAQSSTDASVQTRERRRPQPPLSIFSRPSWAERGGRRDRLPWSDKRSQGVATPDAGRDRRASFRLDGGRLLSAEPPALLDV